MEINKKLPIAKFVSFTENFPDGSIYLADLESNKVDLIDLLYQSLLSREAYFTKSGIDWLMANHDLQKLAAMLASQYPEECGDQEETLKFLKDFRNLEA